MSVARGQRGWKRHPDGGSIGFGGSPSSTIRSRSRLRFGSGIGIAASSASRVGHDRLRVELLRRRELDDLAQVHHGDPVRDVAHDAQVVRDEQVREAELVLEVVEQVDDLRLDRDVERGDRLVEQDQPRLERERAGDADPLALAAGELVRDSGWRAPAPGRPVSSSSRTRGRTSSLVRAACSGAPMICPTRLRGFSDANGSWKTICISRRSGPQRPLAE